MMVMKVKEEKLNRDKKAAEEKDTKTNNMLDDSNLAPMFFEKDKMDVLKMVKQIEELSEMKKAEEENAEVLHAKVEKPRTS